MRSSTQPATADRLSTDAARIDTRYLLTVTMLAIVYISLAKLGFALAFATKQVTAVWPPTGIAVAALLLGSYRIWPGIWLGAFVSNAISDVPLLAAAGIATGNTLGPLLAALLLNRFVRFDPGLARLRDVLGLVVFGAALAMCVTASNGVVNLVLAGIIPWSSAVAVGWIWWSGDAMGVLLVAPVILTWATDSHVRWPGTRLLELAVLVLALLAAAWFSFSSDLPLAYPVFPFVIWAALRFGQRETASAIVLISAIAIWGTIHEQGPFASGSLDQRLILLVTFMAVLAVTGLVLGAVTVERRRAEESLQRAHDELEARVRARTTELAAANSGLMKANAELNVRTAELANKNEEVEAFVYIVSHDLRAPLVNLQGFSKELELSCTELEDALRGAALPEDRAGAIQSILGDGIRGALRYIGASVTKFERLINALLVLSRTGQQQFRLEEANVDAIVATTIASLRHTVEEAGARVSVGPLPKALGDVTAIGQVFANLIGNALKYLHPGRPAEIEIGGDAGEAGDSVVRFWVRDNGAGIPASARPRLFQVFQRFHPELASGEGMGLAAVKRIVERLGGKIWADSDPGVGSTFYFTLPAINQRT